MAQLSEIGLGQAGGVVDTVSRHRARCKLVASRELAQQSLNQALCDCLMEPLFDGATRRGRTGDLLITNQPLYQLS